MPTRMRTRTVRPCKTLHHDTETDIKHDQCLIITKAGRCIVNCVLSNRARPVDQQAPVTMSATLCRLFIAMQAFTGGPSGYAKMDQLNVVLVDGGSYLVAVLCAAGSFDVASSTFCALQVCHVFGQRYQQVVRDLHARHQYAEEQLLVSSSALSGRRDRDDRGIALPTVPVFEEFERVFLRRTLAVPSRERWLRPLLQFQGVQHVLLLDTSRSKVLLSLSSGSSGGHDCCSGGCTPACGERIYGNMACRGSIGSFLSQCWNTVIGYAQLLCEDAEQGQVCGVSLPYAKGPSKRRDEVVLSLPLTSAVLGGIQASGPSRDHPRHSRSGTNPDASVVLCFKTVRLSNPACLVLLYYPTGQFCGSVASTPSTPSAHKQTQLKSKPTRITSHQNLEQCSARSTRRYGAEPSLLPARSQTQNEMLRHLYFSESYHLVGESEVGTVPPKIVDALRVCAGEMANMCW